MTRDASRAGFLHTMIEVVSTYRMNDDQRHEFDNFPESELLRMIAAYPPGREEHEYCRLLLDRQTQARMEQELRTLSDRVSHLGRPEWKTQVFWIALATFLVAAAALLRDVVDWTIFGLGRPESTHQPPIPETPEPAPQVTPIHVSDPAPSIQSASPTQ